MEISEKRDVFYMIPYLLVTIGKSMYIQAGPNIEALFLLFFSIGFVEETRVSTVGTQV